MSLEATGQTFSGSDLHVSPGLHQNAVDGAASEVKCLVPLDVATDVEEHLANMLSQDPNADPNQGGYRVTSLYFDTPEFHTYRREEGYKTQKYRIRRYGKSANAYVERKSRNGVQVRKFRTQVSVEEVPLVYAEATDGHPAQWFAMEVLQGNLRPVGAVTYDRRAFVGINEKGPVRATLDRQAVARLAHGWEVDLFREGIPLITDFAILELKFLVELPVGFQEVMSKFQLDPTKFSKYRRCIEVLELAPKIVCSTSLPSDDDEGNPTIDASQRGPSDGFAASA